MTTCRSINRVINHSCKRDRLVGLIYDYDSSGSQSLFQFLKKSDGRIFETKTFRRLIDALSLKLSLKIGASR